MFVISCVLCSEEGKDPFEVEYDTEGAALMRKHLAEHEGEEE